MLRVIVVNTGTKYDSWYNDNIKHMIDTYSRLEYDEFHVLQDDRYEMQVANKLIMFEKFTDGQNIYFDLDTIIKGDCNKFLTENLTVCKAWWRPPVHSPINSSIISWQGNYSHINDLYESQEDYYMLKYNKGIDQYLYELFSPETFTDGFCSYQTIQQNLPEFPVVLYNQRYQYLTSQGWWTQYQLPVPSFLQQERELVQPSKSG